MDLTVYNEGFIHASPGMFAPQERIQSSMSCSCSVEASLVCLFAFQDCQIASLRSITGNPDCRVRLNKTEGLSP